MNINTEERLFVVSDLHIGNPSFRNKAAVLNFLEFVIAEKASLVINGDGIDFLQPSLTNFVRTLPEILDKAIKIARQNKVYYIIGNHDVFLEHMLFDLGVFKIVPFLNVRSGQAKIHIEHAHVYDDLYIRFPQIYHILGRWWGHLLRLFPFLYPTYSLLERIAGIQRMMTKTAKSPYEEKPVFRQAAALILDRGYDAVIFGHTHRCGKVEVFSNKYYFNTGSWFTQPAYVDINGGRINLRPIPLKG